MFAVVMLVPLLHFGKKFFIDMRGLTEAEAGIALALMALVAGALGSSLSGVIGDKLSKRGIRGGYALLAGAAFLAGWPCLLVGFLAHQKWVFLPALTVGCFFYFLCLFIFSVLSVLLWLISLPAEIRSRLRSVGSLLRPEQDRSRFLRPQPDGSFRDDSSIGVATDVDVPFRVLSQREQRLRRSGAFQKLPALLSPQQPCIEGKSEEGRRQHGLTVSGCNLGMKSEEAAPHDPG